MLLKHQTKFCAGKKYGNKVITLCCHITTITILILVLKMMFLFQNIYGTSTFKENETMEKTINTAIIVLKRNTTFFSREHAAVNNTHKYQINKDYIQPENYRLNWLGNLKKPKGTNVKYFLVQVLCVRIYAHDKAKWTVRELKQWIHYMFYAGVEHIFLCDHYENENEVLQKHLHNYTDKNLITYIPFPTTKMTLGHQAQCYNSIVSKHKHDIEWQMSLDMDEFPYVENDTKEGFLIRYIKSLPSDVVEVLMPNYLMLGQGDRSRNMTIERYVHISCITTMRKTNAKWIFHESQISDSNPHSGVELRP